MGGRELRKLRRVELLELLLEERRENEELRQQVRKLEEQLADKNLKVAAAGTLAEAALRLNGVFEAADRAAVQYLENIRNSSAMAGTMGESCSHILAADRDKDEL